MAIDAAAEVFEDRAEGFQDGDQCGHRVVDGLAQRFVGGAGGCAAQPREQLFGGAPAAVAVLDAERGQAFGAQVLGVAGGRVAGQELQGDRRFDVGEDGLGAGPVRIQQRGELVGRGDTHRRPGLRGCAPRCAAPWSAAMYGVASCSRCWRSRRYSAMTSASPASDLAPESDLAVPPSLDRVGFDRYHRVPGLQQGVDQAPVGTFDRDRHGAGVTEAGQPAHQAGQAVGRVFHGERGDPPPGGVLHADRVCGSAAQSIPTKNTCSNNLERQHNSFSLAAT